jgi:hypothetical protein
MLIVFENVFKSDKLIKKIFYTWQTTFIKSLNYLKEVNFAKIARIHAAESWSYMLQNSVINRTCKLIFEPFIKNDIKLNLHFKK